MDVIGSRTTPSIHARALPCLTLWRLRAAIDQSVVSREQASKAKLRVDS